MGHDPNNPTTELPNHLGALGNIPCELFGGVVQHSPAEIYMVERVLDYRKPARIVEIGTGTGRLTLYFGVWAACNRPCQVTTIDRLLQASAQVRNCLNLLEVRCLHGDSFVDDFRNSLLATRHSLLLYCDGGNKEKELQTFAPLLGPGDVICCHDYGTEVDPAEFGDVWATEHGLRPLWPEVFAAYGCLNRAWQKRA